jgi:TPR repeat protein
MHETEIDFDIQYGLGICYYYGLGIEKNTQLALSHLIASEDWHDEVPYLIGSIYYENSDERAIKYLTKALSRHNLNDAIRCEVLCMLSDCYRSGKCGVKINIEEADRFAMEAKKYKLLTQRQIKDYFVSLSQIKIDYDNFKALIY